MSAKIKQAMLMTAGLGERLKPYTLHSAKPFLPVLGTPVLEYAVESLRHAGVKKWVCNLHHLPEKSLDEIASLARKTGQADPAIVHQWVTSDERSLLLGSGGGIVKALPHFGEEPFYLVNGDVLSDIDYTELAVAHERNRREFGATLTLAIHERSPGSGKYNEVLLGPLVSQTGQIKGLGGRDRLRMAVPFFTGSAVIEPEALRGLPSERPLDFVASCLEPAIQKGTAGAFVVNGSWHDVGSPRMWWETHLDLLTQWSAGKVPTPWASRWGATIECIAPGVYCKRGFSDADRAAILKGTALASQSASSGIVGYISPSLEYAVGQEKDLLPRLTKFLSAGVSPTNRGAHASSANQVAAATQPEKMFTDTSPRNLVLYGLPNALDSSKPFRDLLSAYGECTYFEIEAR